MNKYGVWLLAILSGILLSGRDSLTVGDAPKVHEQALTVDTHCDTPMRMVRGFNVARRHDTSNGRVDFPRMKEGGWMRCFLLSLPGNDNGYLKIIKGHMIWHIKCWIPSM